MSKNVKDWAKDSKAGMKITELVAIFKAELPATEVMFANRIVFCSEAVINIHKCKLG